MNGSKETRSCATCGQPLTRYVSQARGKNWYCNARCQAAHTPPPATISKVPNPTRGQRETRSCGVCGEPVTRYLSQTTMGQEWTCSRTCGATARTRKRMAAGTWQRPVNTRKGESNPCAICGAPVYRNASQATKGQGQFCSVACRAKAQAQGQQAKSCAHCGAAFTVQPSRAGQQFCSKRCDGLARIQRPAERMHNGKPVRHDPSGYVLLWEPEHPNKSMRGWQFEHRLVMEKALGRYLRSDEHVDHIQPGNKADNRPENLQVLSHSEHSKKTSVDRRTAAERMEAELAEYRRRYGPLSVED